MKYGEPSHVNCARVLLTHFCYFDAKPEKVLDNQQNHFYKPQSTTVPALAGHSRNKLIIVTTQPNNNLTQLG